MICGGFAAIRPQIEQDVGREIMNTKHAVAAAGLALALLSGAAHATTFDYTGGFQSFVAPTAGTYDITSYGAQGGGVYGTTALGGLGAEIGGDFTLTKGETLTVLVGGMGGYGGQGNGVGQDPEGGGGGGSFVYTAIVGTFGYVPVPPNTPFSAYKYADTFTGYAQLADAGGGGGHGGAEQYFEPGGEGLGYSGGPFPGAGGTSVGEGSGPGAGYDFFGSGGTGAGNAPAFGGQGGTTYNTFLGPDNDGHGGFGGGGAGIQGINGGTTGGGGGGGGCEGGDGADTTGGYGGYSCLANGTPTNVALSGVQAGNGLVTINLVSAVSAAPEPSTWALMMAGIGGIGLMLRRKKREGGTLAALLRSNSSDYSGLTERPGVIPGLFSSVPNDRKPPLPRVQRVRSRAASPAASEWRVSGGRSPIAVDPLQTLATCP